MGGGGGGASLSKSVLHIGAMQIKCVNVAIVFCTVILDSVVTWFCYIFVSLQELNSQLFVADQTDGPSVSVQNVGVSVITFFFSCYPPYHSGTCFRLLCITIGITSFLPCKENFAVWLPQMSLSSLSNSINALELVLHHWHCKCTLFIWINLGFRETAHLPLP